MQRTIAALQAAVHCPADKYAGFDLTIFEHVAWSRLPAARTGPVIPTMIAANISVRMASSRLDC